MVQSLILIQCWCLEHVTFHLNIVHTVHYVHIYFSFGQPTFIRYVYYQHNVVIVHLICSNVFSAPQVYNLHCHYNLLRTDNCGVLQRKTEKLKCDLQQQNNKAAVAASFIISQIITKTTKPIKGDQCEKGYKMKAAEILF